MPTLAARSSSISTNPAPPAHGFTVEPTPEVVLAFDLVRLPREHEDPPNALALHPYDGGARALDEELCHVDVGSALGHAHEVVVELVVGVRRHHDGTGLLLGDVGQDVSPEIFEALVREAEPARGEERVAATLGFRSLFDHENRGAR